MSDLIKKVKIKKQDGTYTDYIPIGVEAKNVDCPDGESVEYKLNKKPYYYDTVADMKADINLKAGDMAVTLGYYNINDGGGANYVIVSNANSNSKHYEKLINNLKAELIVGLELNIKQMGAYGDNVHDDSNIIRTALAYIYRAEPQKGWRHCRTIYFPHGKYLISKSLVDTNLSIYGGSFKFKGDGQFSSVIRCSETVDVIFDNNQMFGFTTFEDMQFLGYEHQTIFMNFVGGGPGNAQSLRINKCTFNSFKTIIATSGETMCSEVTFFECKISSCGTSANQCELFILNNSQAVNWRFYSTDIESFNGILFNYKKGCNISWYQGSCIPQGNSIVINGTSASYNFFGGGNRPNLIMHGVRFEMRDNSCLLKKGYSKALFTLIFHDCGMGGANIPTNTTVKTINLDDGGSQLYFYNCYNLKNYSISSDVNLDGHTSTTDILKFKDCGFEEPIQSVIDRSDFHYTGTAIGFLCKIIVNDVAYWPKPGIYQYVAGSTFTERIIQNAASDLGIVVRNNNVGNIQEKTYYINSFISHVKVRNLMRTAYGSAAKFTLKFYDDNNNLLGTVNEPIQSNKYNEIYVGKYVKNLKMTSTSDVPTSIYVYDPIIISVERL